MTENQALERPLPLMPAAGHLTLSTGDTPVTAGPGCIDELKQIVGEAHVVDAPADVERRARVTIPRRKMPRAFVYPGSTAEVQQIVALANRHQILLWPCSTGRNWGYGAATPQVEGSLVVVLERIDRVLEVNEELAYAVIEPGVTYEQFNAYLKQHHPRLWIDCTDGPPNGSVLGNALERGIGETPNGDHFGCICGMEVVLPTGERIQTGGGAIDGLRTWNTHKWGTGPYLEGIFTQSNLGIVTKAGIWLMPEPEAYCSYIFEVYDAGRFPELVDTFRRLALQGVLQTKLHLINDVVLFTVLTQLKNENLGGQSFLTQTDIARLRDKYQVAPWAGGSGIYGTKDQVRYQKKVLRQELARFGRIEFMDRRKYHLVTALLPIVKRLRNNPTAKKLIDKTLRLTLKASVEMLEAAPRTYDILQGIPTEYFVSHAYFRSKMDKPFSKIDPAVDGCGLTWFAPILPLTVGDLVPFLDHCRQRFEAFGFNFYVAMLMMNARSIIALQAILFDRDKPDELERAEALYADLVSYLQGHGLQQYRTGVQCWDMLFDEAPEFLALNNKLKAALDPNNILSPGKCRIGAPQ